MRSPDQKGGKVRAWNISGRIPELATDELQRQSALASWLLHVPWAHPFWTWYVLHVVSLADVPGFPPSHKFYPDASYQLIVGALHPDSQPYDPDTATRLAPLRPIDQAVQFHGITDAQAIRVAGEMVRLVTLGLSPDQDFRSQWSTLVGEVVRKICREA